MIIQGNTLGETKKIKQLLDNCWSRSNNGTFRAVLTKKNKIRLFIEESNETIAVFHAVNIQTAQTAKDLVSKFAYESTI